MMPTAYEIAVAIVAAARETGAEPLSIPMGGERQLGCPVDKMQAISRARAYAGRAIDRVFNRPEIAIARRSIARLIGVNSPSWDAFFPALNRKVLWWDEAAFKRVVDALMDCEPPEEQIKAKEAPQAASIVQKPAEVLKAARLQRVPDPVVKWPIGTLDRGGYRPPPDTVKRVLEDDKRSGPYVPVGRPLFKKDDDFLRRAVENTQKLTPPPED